jgi:hypothetical protein
LAVPLPEPQALEELVDKAVLVVSVVERLLKLRALAVLLVQDHHQVQQGKRVVQVVQVALLAMPVAIAEP